MASPSGLLQMDPSSSTATIGTAPEFPYQQQNPIEVNELIGLLNGADRTKSTGGRFSCRKSTFSIDGTDYKIDSWKFPEMDFKKRELPTYARGLFTWRDPASGNHRIAVRGYDKFFNVNEIQRTKWGWIKEHTKGPYELAVKENGCIIFASGLPDGTLLVCSKHSTGAGRDAGQSHASVGERWIDKQLAKIGRTRKQFAEALYKANITAVAELCDDSFEEHILPYEGDEAGLYLHGVNFNLKVFATYSMPEVNRFAEEWGFRKIDYLVKDNVDDLRKFLEESAETGSWDDKDVEGFVIRSKARHDSQDPEWHDWFFKFKFEEPYLMYRQWRECTKAMISGRGPRIRKQKEITAEYLRFAAGYFSKNKGASVEYNKNHGIIQLRNAFLAHRGLKGSDIVKQAAEHEDGTATKLVLVPVATIGCGKTTIAYALTQLYGWGHKQNDNITTKKGKGQAFASACAMELVDLPVVFADRNNHLKRERQQLIDDIGSSAPQVLFVALHYVHNSSDKELQARIRDATRNRVFARGDNHQTIQAATKGRAEIQGIMEGFLGRFEPVDVDSSPDSNFDLVIDLDPTKDSRKNLEIVVRKLHEIYPSIVPEIPTPERLDEAIKASFEEYKPAVKHTIGKNSLSLKNDNENQPQKAAKIEYFSINLPAKSILNVVEGSIAAAPEEKRVFFNQLKSDGRVQANFHITLMHNSSIKQNSKLWETYLKQFQNATPGVMGKAKIKLQSLVWDGRVMAIVADILDKGWVCTNQFPHVTIGTISSVKPKEANDMLVGKWQHGKAEQLDLVGDVELYGTVEAMNVRWHKSGSRGGGGRGGRGGRGGNGQSLAPE